MNDWTRGKTYLVGAVGAAAAAFAVQFGCGGGDETNDGGCPASQTLCGGLCVNTASDPANCGSCGNACASGEECAGGACQCAAGTSLCGGTCINTATDPANCGSCGTTCSEFEECIDGECQCPQGMAPCTGGCADLSTDELNCGQCNLSCAAGQECIDGECSCPDGTELCFTQCVDTTSDAKFCGDCNTPCDSGEYCNESNCETINTCADVAEDQYEGNDTCQLARELPVANENAAAATISSPTLHHTDQTLDTDWFKIPTAEAFHLDCVTNPLSSQCYFVFDIAFTPPDVAAHDTYQMCIRSGSCTETANCTSASDWNSSANAYELALQWEGTCGFDDEPEMYVEIKRNGGTESCEQYTLEYQMTYTDEVCP